MYITIDRSQIPTNKGIKFDINNSQQAVRDEQAAETRAQLAKIGQAAVAEPNAMERCLAALDVVEGSATPPRPPTPPMTTDRISYEDSLRMTRLR